jgi:hypothetical protein
VRILVDFFGRYLVHAGKSQRQAQGRVNHLAILESLRHNSKSAPRAGRRQSGWM